jgi:hypothetical protein
MKTKILGFVVCVALLGVSWVGAAKAASIVFDVSGTLLANPPTTTMDTTLSGTLTIDVSTGTLTAVDLMVPGFSDFTHLDGSEASGVDDWYISTDNGTGCGPAVDCLEITIATSPTGASLVDLESASLVGAILGGGCCTVFYVDVATGGTVTPEASAVPGPIAGAGAPGILFAGSLLAWWRRNRKLKQLSNTTLLASNS